MFAGPAALRDQTSITMTYYHTPTATAANPYPAPIAFDSFKAVRPLRDGWLSDASKKAAVTH